MTTTTRTTRKAPWAAVLTALLTVLGLVFGVMTLAAPAAANDNPGVCDELDSGKIDLADGIMSQVITAPAGMLIDGYCIKAGSLAKDLGPKYVSVDPAVASMTITYNFTDPPKDISHYSFSWSAAPTYSYAGTGQAQARECTLVESTWGYMDFGPFTVTGDTVTKSTLWSDADKAVEDAKAKTAAELQLATEMAEYTIDLTGVSCQTTPPPTPGSVTFCVTPAGTTAYVYDTFGTADNTTPQSTWTNGSGQPLSAYVVGTTADCTPTPPPPPAPPVTPPAEEPVPVTAVEPATVVAEAEAVAPVLPATVPAEAPEAVAVPAPATVALPAAVPAGDGSTVPQVPIALLALLALATAAAVTSGLRMATNR